MKEIPAGVVEFLKNQGFVIVSSIDAQGFPHNACKNIVQIDPRGEIFLIDLYHGVTKANITRLAKISISAIDEYKFEGYALKGEARILPHNNLTQSMISSWENNITSRLAKRLLKHLAEEKGQRHHPEAILPEPKYIIALNVQEIVDLTPHHLRKEGENGKNG